MVRCVALLVATERLGWPGKESGWLERSGIVQKRSRYANRPDEPSALYHLQPASDEKAFCDYPWEQLIAVPGQPSWSSLDDGLRCGVCDAHCERA